MSKNRKKQNTTEELDAWVSMSLSISIFILSIFLFYEQNYFDGATGVINVILTAIGIFILGISLSVISQQTTYKEKQYDKFGFMGAGVAILIIWLLVYRSLLSIWANIILFPILFFGIYAIILGVINLMRSRMSASGFRNRNDPLTDEKPKSIVLRLLNGFAWAIGLLASLLQLLQYFKFIR